MTFRKCHTLVVCALLALLPLLSGCATAPAREPVVDRGPGPGLTLGAGPVREPEPSASINPDSEPIPPVPVVSEFILGVGDQLDIKVYRQEDLNRTMRVPSDGVIYFPLIGEVQARGIGVRQLRDTMAQKLSKYLMNPQVTIEITTYRSQKVFVLGEVSRPGVYELDGAYRTIEAVALAGGFTRDARGDNVLLIRGMLEKPLLKKLNLNAALQRADFNHNPYLERGDVIYVPATAIAKVDRFFQRLNNVLLPIVRLEQAIILSAEARGVLRGENPKNSTSTIIITPP